MPVPSKPGQNRTPEQVRKAIRTVDLLNRLEAFALNQALPGRKAADGTRTPPKLSRDHIKAIELLLRKTMPDLSTVTIEGGTHSTMDVRLYMPDNHRGGVPPDDERA